MNRAEERLVFLEGRVEEQTMRIDDVRDAVSSLALRIDRLEERMDLRFAGVDQRLDSIDGKFGRLYGLMIAMLIAIVGGMSGIIAAILQQR